MGDKIKIGRTCFTCMHRIKRQVEYIRCKHTDDGNQPLWSQAHCAKWQLTDNIRVLSQFEQFVDTKDLDVSRFIREFYYHKSNDIKVHETVKLALGRSCYLCEHKGSQHGNKVDCTKRDGMMVWKRACCKHFKLNVNPGWLYRIARYMAKSGINTKGTQWAKAPKLPSNRTIPHHIDRLTILRTFYPHLRWEIRELENKQDYFG